MLFAFYFGASAPAAQRAACARLKKWSWAFEGWMAERKRVYQKNTVKQARLAWRRLVRQCGKMPWEMRREDIEQHAAWMKEQGYTTSTVHGAIGILASFYQWCDQRRVDRSCEKGFNPAAEVRRPRVGRYTGAQLLRREEVERLLSLLKRDTSVLGKRDQAFTLARLRLGVPLNRLQQLKWGQIEQDEVGAWVRWREDGDRMRLPEEVWEAVKEYLRASGRLEGMEAGKHIFAPLAEPGKEETGGRAEDWVEERCLSTSQVLANLKLYGRRAGIAEDKLTLMTLRRTAIRLKLDEGQAVKEMQIFMDSQEDSKFAKYRLKKLPELPQGQRMINPDDTDGGQRREEGQVPVRKAKPFRLGENVKHGFYARGKDMEAVKAVMAENIQGLDEEISCLRRLMRGLLEREGNEARVMLAYSGAAQRLRELVTTKQKAEQKKEDTWAEEFLSNLDEIEVRNGRLPVSQSIREHALKSEGELSTGSRLMTEEVATIRLLLRNTYRQVAEEQDMAEYLRLVDLYGAGCVRLARMLRFNCDENDQLKRYLNRMIDEAIRQLTREWRLDREASDTRQAVEPGL